MIQVALLLIAGAVSDIPRAPEERPRAPMPAAQVGEEADKIRQAEANAKTRAKIAELMASMSKRIDDLDGRLGALEKRAEAVEALRAAEAEARPIGPNAESVPTPQNEVDRVLALLPKPEIGFVDFGCGSDARWCIAAAKKWGCSATGIEIDPTRAALAKRRVDEAGLGQLVTIIEGDAIATGARADVGVAYLFPAVLERLKPRIEKLRAFASYIHRPAGLPVVQNGDSWIYTKPAVAAAQPRAVWNGQQYAGPLCNSPNCGMCASIRAQLANQTVARSTAGGHYERRKFCNGVSCWYADVWVAD